MDVRRMIADVGGIVKVNGSKIATPFAPPSPGSTPMMVPSTIPITAMTKLKGVTAIWNPRDRFSSPPMRASVPEPSLERALWQGDQKPDLEDEERRQRDRERNQYRRDPSVPADHPHVSSHVHRATDIQAEEV